jgi:hypothetical protein
MLLLLTHLLSQTALSFRRFENRGHVTYVAFEVIQSFLFILVHQPWGRESIPCEGGMRPKELENFGWTRRYLPMGFCLLSAMEAFTRSFFWWPYRISCLIRLSPVLVAGRLSRCFRSLPLVLVFSALRDGDAFSNASNEFRANLFEAMRGIFCRLDPENCGNESENGNSKEFNTQKKKKLGRLRMVHFWSLSRFGGLAYRRRLTQSIWKIKTN